MRPSTNCLVVILLLCAAGTAAGAAQNKKARPAIILDGGEAEAIAFPLHPTFRLADADTNLAGMSFFEIRIAAGAPGAPPHTHTHEDEFFYVREGRVTFLTDQEQRTIGPGGFVLLPRNGLHAVWNVGTEDAVLLVGTSGGKFGDFFDAVAMEVQASNAASPQEVGAIVGRLGAERGIVIDMSKVPAEVAALYGL